MPRIVNGVLVSDEELRRQNLSASAGPSPSMSSPQSSNGDFQAAGVNQLYDNDQRRQQQQNTSRNDSHFGQQQVQGPALASQERRATPQAVELFRKIGVDLQGKTFPMIYGVGALVLVSLFLGIQFSILGGLAGAFLTEAVPQQQQQQQPVGGGGAAASLAGFFGSAGGSPSPSSSSSSGASSGSSAAGSAAGRRLGTMEDIRS